MIAVFRHHKIRPYSCLTELLTCVVSFAAMSTCTKNLQKSEPSISPKHWRLWYSRHINVLSDITKDNTLILVIYMHFLCLSFYSCNVLTSGDFTSFRRVLKPHTAFCFLFCFVSVGNYGQILFAYVRNFHLIFFSISFITS